MLRAGQLLQNRRGGFVPAQRADLMPQQQQHAHQRRAHAHGVRIFALTDHDEVGGLAEARAAAERIAEGAPLVARWHKKFARKLMSGQPLTEQEVLDAARAASDRFIKLILKCLQNLNCCAALLDRNCETGTDGMLR